ncbi:hypothetical protein HMN09_00921100 [Mycena chlorophos]|uniref:Phospholipase D/nuclease n=1 Tax=Mycena chlorophos TaxID=658473 RepID=A0A8H6W3I2_MYCCL|nr:hypothetical protein HMN09_00921100 [Mycena chlorophos]
MDFSDGEDDPELARALALSMQEEEERQARMGGKGGARGGQGKNGKREPDVLVISDDDDDEEDDVMEISPPRPTVAKPQPQHTTRKEPTPTPAPAPAKPLVGAGPLSLLGDRAQMERERLARQKRLRPPSPPRTEEQGHSSGEDDDSDGDGASEGSARKRAKLDTSVDENGRRTFPDGKLLRIETKYATSATDPGIRLSEILGPKEELAQAILCAYVVDPVWLYSFFDPTTPVVLVTDAKMCGAKQDGDERGSGPLLRHILPNWVRVCPRVHRIGDFDGSMHMKYMLLFSKSGTLRVVVSSANLVDYDWRDIENYAYIQDFPKATTKDTIARRPGEKAGESFPEVLADVLRATGVNEALDVLRKDGHTSLPLSSLSPSSSKSSLSALERGWDWRAAHSGRVALVPSVSGRWEGWAGEEAVLKYGQPRLMRSIILLGASLEDVEKSIKSSSSSTSKKTVNDLVKRPSKTVSDEPHETELTMSCLGSSLGTYDAPWIAGFRLCAGGKARALQGWLDRGRKKTPQQGPTYILYPTVESINITTLGGRAAGTIFCRPKAWKTLQDMGAVGGTGVSGLRILDARSQSGEGVAMHTKMILGTLPKTASAAPSSKKPGKKSRTPLTDQSETESDTESDDSVEIVETTQPPPHAWLYAGSHNFTAAAWGRMSGSGFNPVLTISNYELGVVFRLETPVDVEKSVAWARPARPYIRGDEPWIQPILRHTPMPTSP